MDREVMLDLLEDIIQSSHIWGDSEQHLLNFISELREEYEDDE